MWKASPPPEELWTDDEGGSAGGQWPIVGIVGEEIDSSGSSTFEIRWAEWNRDDGSNTTWMPDLVDHPGVVRRWQRRQKLRREHLAIESLSIPIYGGLDIHNINTILRAQAYDEKLQKINNAIPTSTTLRHKMDRLLREKGNREDGEASSPRTLRRSTSLRQLSRCSSAGSLGNRSNTTSHSSWSGKSNTSAGLTCPTRSLPQRVKTSLSIGKEPRLRAALEKEWKTAARKEHAALISIVNEIDEDEIPDEGENFIYCERKYVYGKNVPRLTDLECLVSCDCESCVASKCDCQDLSKLQDDDGRPAFAYTKEGLFAFTLPRGDEVIECNQRCSCDQSCPNRVAQKPRDIPIQVFKTEDRGWGARSTVAVERGKVLGVYTGELIHREDAQNRGNYCFDLDGNECRSDKTPENSYSVDSQHYGNWTRFINHSCEPNTRVFPVIYDTIPEMNMPYLAFVTLKDLPAGTEFTVDYNPAAGRAITKGKGKGKSRIPDDAMSCQCGTAQCRGWINL